MARVFDYPHTRANIPATGRLYIHHRTPARTPRSLQIKRRPRQCSPMLGTAFFSVGRRIRAYTSPERVHKLETRLPIKPLPRYGSPIASNELCREDICRQRAQILAGAQEATTRVTAQSEPPSTAHADREREYSSSKQDDFSGSRTRIQFEQAGRLLRREVDDSATQHKNEMPGYSHLPYEVPQSPHTHQ
jgi:hypothetical protein